MFEQSNNSHRTNLTKQENKAIQWLFKNNNLIIQQTGAAWKSMNKRPTDSWITLTTTYPYPVTPWRIWKGSWILFWKKNTGFPNRNMSFVSRPSLGWRLPKVYKDPLTHREGLSSAVLIPKTNFIGKKRHCYGRMFCPQQCKLILRTSGREFYTLFCQRFLQQNKVVWKVHQ